MWADTFWGIDSVTNTRITMSGGYRTINTWMFTRWTESFSFNMESTRRTDTIVFTGQLSVFSTFITMSGGRTVWTFGWTF
jgi:hypothetical protein